MYDNLSCSKNTVTQNTQMKLKIYKHKMSFSILEGQLYVYIFLSIYYNYGEEAQAL